MNKVFVIILLILLISCKVKNNENNGNTGNLPGHDKSFIYNTEKQYALSELEKFTKLELMLMKAEIYARYGILKGNFWQKQYVMFKNWYKPKPNADESKLSNNDKENLKKINKVIKQKRHLVFNIERPAGLKLKSVNTFLKLTENKKIKILKGTISKEDWKVLKGKEYGQEKRNPKIKQALVWLENYNGFYRVFVDKNKVVRIIENHAGCCSYIIGNEMKELYIFDVEGKLKKKIKYDFGKLEAEKYYIYNNGKFSKVISLYYEIRTGKLLEIGFKKI